MGSKHKIKMHISQNRGQYILITLIFIIGAVIGDYKVLDLEGGVKSHLLGLIDNYLKGGMQTDLSGQTILLNSFLNQAKSILAIWFLGLTVIGIPLIFGLVLLKGFSLGFTIGFLVQEKAGAGIIISIISILPQNIVYIPFLIIWSVIAINFSMYIVTGRSENRVPLGRALLSYSLLMFLFLLIVLIGAFIEAYLSPWLLSLFLP